jgi:hypothetical protein
LCYFLAQEMRPHGCLVSVLQMNSSVETKAYTVILLATFIVVHT